MKAFFQSNPAYSTLLLRLGAGAMMLPFGLMKIGMMPGSSFEKTVEMMTGMGVPYFLVILVIMAEVLGAAALVLGFCTRFCAAALTATMIGAVYYTFGMGYMSGYALPLAFTVMYLPLVLSGGGAWSLDNFIAKKLK